MRDNVTPLRTAWPRAQTNADAPDTDAALESMDILHLAELVPIVRDRLGLDSAFPDSSILASLKSIVAHSAPRERWRAAFASNLGVWMALKGCDLNTELNSLIALLPKPQM